MDKEFIAKYDIYKEVCDFDSPLTIGNGNLAFTCDYTGLQGFYNDYKNIPLCTMTNVIWAGKEAKGLKPYKVYNRASDGKEIAYMTDTESPNYTSYRDDFFKFDLFKLAFNYKNFPLEPDKIVFKSQRLDIFRGIITTNFTYLGEDVKVLTSISQKTNTLYVKVISELCGLQIQIFFLKPASNIRGMEDLKEDFSIKDNQIIRKGELCNYILYFSSNMSHNNGSFTVEKNSYLAIGLAENMEYEDLSSYFKKAFRPIMADEELNKRMVLSLYLLKVNTLGIYPPAETGLTCNSWYGKFHLEMHLWHHLGLIRLGLGEYVLPSLKWYLTIYNSSLKRAKEQGYCGLRLPKMTDFRGLDTPSNIGCLLIWQMPHLIVMLEEMFKITNDRKLIEPFFEFVYEQMLFLESFFYLKDGKYHLDSPLIAATENVEYYQDTPIFELGYSLYALNLFLEWQRRFNLPYHLKIAEDILKRSVDLPTFEGAYENFLGATNTYTYYNYDHPMTIALYSYIKSPLIVEDTMNKTLDKVLANWRLEDCWGWDFPMLAMTAHNLKRKYLALEILKLKTPKNTYTKIGHNPQGTRSDLPIYLPGNGAFILAISYLFDLDTKS